MFYKTLIGKMHRKKNPINKKLFLGHSKQYYSFCYKHFPVIQPDKKMKLIWDMLVLFVIMFFFFSHTYAIEF